MKKFFSTLSSTLQGGVRGGLLFLALVATTALWAEDFSVNGIYYNILADKTNEVEVTYCSSGYAGSVTIPSTVTYNGVIYSVTSIGNWAFIDCSGLTSITIPNSVTSIGESAFSECSGLTSITIPNSVTSIGDVAFYSCSGLTSITIPESVTSIGYGAFIGCSSVTSIFWNAKDYIDLSGWNYTDENYLPFYDIRSQITSFVFGNNVEYIPIKLCYGMENITSIRIPNSVVTIGESAFSNCYDLTFVTIDIGVASIGDCAFERCFSLTSITIPNSVTSIGKYAFFGSSSLSSITIPNSVTSIGDWAFAYCEGLTSITIPNSVTSIGESAFRYCSGLISVIWNAENCADFFSSYSPFYDISSQITSFTLGEDVKHIPASLCDGMSKLTSITIPNSVTSIGESAFGYCSGLTSITIPNSVTSMGSGVFYECNNLTSVVWNAKNCKDFDYSDSPFWWYGDGYIKISPITSLTFGEEVEHIPAYICCNMSSLESITISQSVTSIGEDAFDMFHADSISLSSIIWNAKRCIYLAESEASPFSYVTSQITSFTFGNSVEVIPAYLCRNMGNLTSITIPNSVTSIGNSAFAGCKGLTSITIPNSVTSIGDDAFYGCSRLTSISIPESVTSIGNYAFRDCSSVEYLSVSNNNVESIGMWAFYGLNALKEITMKAPSLEDYCKSKLSKLLYDSAHINDDAIRKIEINGEEMIDWSIPASVTQIEDYTFYNCPSITSVTLPKTITTIGKSAFKNCTSITSMDIPNKVTRIGNNAFEKCPLATITIPNNVTTIGSYAFNSCDKLSSVILGESVDSIGGNAFYGCRKLYDIYCYAPEPPYAVASGWNPTFENTNVNLYVPCDNLKAFQMDPVFGLFKYIHCIDSEDVSTDGVIIAPGNTDVTITWPTEDNADTYAIVIEKDGEVVCTLTFNADGQLLNIAFAPGRDGNHPAQYAEQTTNGYRFTIIGLEEGSNYTYTITIKDASNKTINTHSGAFTTQSTTNLENIDTRHPITDNRKIIRNGQLVIIRDGVEYNAQGQIVKE